MLARVDLRGSADVRAALARPPGRGRRRRAPRSPRSSPTCAPGATPRSASCTERFDGCRARRPRRARAPSSTPPLDRLDPALRAALELARDQIVGVARGAGRRASSSTSARASRCASCVVPVDRAGCYVPGGRAPLASSVLMTALPGPGRRRAGGRAVHAARRRRHACTTRSSRRRGSPGSTRCTGSAARRRSPRSRTAPRRSTRST